MIRRIITGEYGPRLEGELLREVRRLKGAGTLEPVVIVIPTNVLGLHLSRYLARELGGHAEIRFATLLDVARWLGEESLARRRLSAVPPLADHLLLRRSIEECLNERDGSYFRLVSETAGFPRVFLSAVGDLKEGLLTPADLDRAAGSAGLGETAAGKVREISRLWRDYESRKTAAGFYDRADLMAEAASPAASESCFAGIETILFYGFYDLNPLQRRLVERCARTRGTVFFLPFIDSPAFDYARPAVEWLRSLGFEGDDRGNDPDGPPGMPCGLGRLRRGLFVSGAGSDPVPGAGEGSDEDRERDGASSREGVIILSAAGEESESREIVRELLRLAGLQRSNESPPRFRLNEVGILLGNPSSYVGPLTQILTGLDVEPYVREGLPLSGTRAGRSLLLLTELIESDLSRRQVMDFLTFAELDVEGLRARALAGSFPDGSVSPARWDLLSKDAGVVRGMDQWRQALSAIMRRGRSSERPGGAVTEAGARDAHGESAAQALLGLMERLSDGGDSLSSPDSPGRMVEKLSALYGGLVAPGRERDRVLEALRDISSLDSCAESIDRSSFFRLVRRSLESAQVRLGSLHGEGPVVAGLMAARGLPFKVVVVPGLTEGSFPTAARQDPVLLDWERRAINGALARMGCDGRLGLRSDRLKEDKLLFRLAAGSASNLLILSYSRVEPLTGAERIPSEFILSAASALRGERCDLESLEELPFYRRVPLAGLFPDDGSFMDQTEFDLMAAARAVSGDKAAGDYLKSRGTFFGSALEAEKRRWDEFRLTPYDGAMESPAALKRLGGMFAGRRGVVFPTSIELYCDCPFLYFMRHILGVEPAEEPEEVLTIPAMDKGALAHEILERAYGEIFTASGGPAPDWERTLTSVAARVLEAFRERSPHGLPLLREVDELRLIDDLVASVAQDLDELGDFRPWKLELRYGIEQGEGGRLELPLGGAGRAALGGKIDRVDLSSSHGRAVVVDYKTGRGGKFKDDRFMGGTTLQLPLYVLGAQHVLGDKAEVVDAQYYFVSGDRRGERVHFAAETVRERMADLLAIIGAAARGVERGLFFAYPGDSCAYCEYKMACAPAQALFERKRNDPRAQEFLRIKEID